MFIAEYPIESVSVIVFDYTPFLEIIEYLFKLDLSLFFVINGTAYGVTEAFDILNLSRFAFYVIHNFGVIIGYMYG